MKRRSFIQHSAVVAGAAPLLSPFPGSIMQNSPFDKEIYELRIYQLTGGASKAPLKNFLTDTVIPFLDNHGCKTGIFSEYSLQEPPKLYVLFAYPTPEVYYRCITGIESDAGYISKGAAYLQSPAEKPLFDRYETLLLEAFDAIPRFRQPVPGRGLFELRIYESYNEDAGRRKIAMFNKDELSLFDKIGLPAVFFGKIIAGTHMPALTYMLSFRDMAHREEAWTKFRSHPEWTAMKDKPEYANAVSKVNKIFLLPEEGSQL